MTLSRLMDYLKSWPQYLLPHHALSGVMHWLARNRNVTWKNAMIRWFIRRFQVDMSQARQPDPAAYENFNAFFTRELAEQARPLPASTKTLVSPVDGTVSQAGCIDDNVIFQAKGHQFTLEQLLGNDAHRTAQFRNGAYATIYLSPRDYHRIHAPLAGRLTQMTYVPGRLFSVNPATTRTVPGLFARNERVIAYFDTALGPVAVVMVGAIFVGSIETVWHGEVTPPRRQHVKVWRYQGQSTIATEFARAAEIARFNMGSTVIILAGPETIDWSGDLRANRNLRMGEAIAEPRAIV